METTYELTSTPALIDLGRLGRATVRAPVPFLVGSTLHCADYPHYVNVGSRREAVIRMSGDYVAGLIHVWPASR